MPINDNTTLWQDFQSWFTKWAKKGELILERFPTPYLVFVLGAAFLGAVADWKSVFGPDWTIENSVNLLLLSVVLLVAFDFAHILLLRRQRRVTIERDRYIENLTNFILVAGQHLSYTPRKTSRRRVNRQIHADGSVEIEQELTLECVNSPILMIDTETWLVNVDQPATLKDLSFRATNPGNNNAKLLSVPVIDGRTLKRYRTLLDTPLTNPGEECTVKFSYKWPNAWKKLLTEGEDSGSIKVVHPVEKYEIVFQVPSGWKLTHFSIAPIPPGYDGRYQKSNEDRTLAATLPALREGVEYQYRLYCTIPTQQTKGVI